MHQINDTVVLELKADFYLLFLKKDSLSSFLKFNPCCCTVANSTCQYPSKSLNITPSYIYIHTILQNKWMRPPIIFERLKLPQQIIYRRKENLSDSPNHLKYRENILIRDFMSIFREMVRI